MTVSRSLIAAVCLIVLLSAGCGLKQTKGVRITLQVAPKAAGWPKEAQDRQRVMEDAKACIIKRYTSIMKRLHLSEEIACVIQDTDKLVVTIPGTTDAQTIEDMLKSTTKSKLEFYYLKNVRNVNNPLGEWQMSSSETNNREYIFIGPNHQKISSVRQPELVLSKVVNTAKNKPVLSDNDILPNAKAGINSRQEINIGIEFSESGKTTFGEFTRKHVNDCLAIFYNDRLLTAPNITEPILDGNAEITGFGTLAEARSAAEMLNAGTMPVSMKVIKKEIVKL